MKKNCLTSFVKKANIVHLNKFDYSKTNYLTNKVPIEIICPFHGSFWQRPDNHLTKKHGCNLCSPTCGGKISHKQFLNKCIKKHGNKYDYSKTVFNGVKSKIIIICNNHGRFEQIAEKHFQYGCPSCAGNNPITIANFIIRANKIHNNKFDYSKVDIINGVHSKIKIICPIHGSFNQIVNNHLRGRGCKYCSIGNSSKKEQNWLNLCNVPNDDEHRNVVLIINNKRFCVDGFFKKEKVIYEFLGDYWHGNPGIFNGNEINKTINKSFKELFNLTINKIRFLRSNGYKVISIWESKYEKKYGNISNCRKSIKSKNNTKLFG